MLKTKVEDGTVSVTIGQTEKDEAFVYEVIEDNNGNTPTFAEVQEYLLSQGYSTELQKAEKVEGQRGRGTEPRSLCRAFIYFHNQKNQQEARSKASQEATDTPETHGARAASELQKMIQHGKATPQQAKRGELAIRLVNASTPEETEAIMRELAGLL